MFHREFDILTSIYIYIYIYIYKSSDFFFLIPMFHRKFHRKFDILTSIYIYITFTFTNLQFVFLPQN